MTYVLVPGAWSGEWVWDQVAWLLSNKGHTVHSLTLSGLRSGDDAKDVTLPTHVQDVLRFLRTNGLGPVVLVGHSYSGIVVGQVAIQAPDMVCHTAFVEAFLPVDGRSLLDVSGLDTDHEVRLIEEHAGLWPAPTLEELEQQPYLSPTQVSLLASRMVGHPGRTVTDPAMLPKPLSAIRATFIASSGWLAGSREATLLASLKEKNSWRFRYVDGGHWPMLTIPDQLADLLHAISNDTEECSS